MAKIGRNDPCPCGSGKKFKKCCLGTDDGEWMLRFGPGSLKDNPWVPADQQMYKGYTYWEKEAYRDACEAWGRAWELLRPLIPEDVTDVVQVDQLYTFESELFANWCQDYAEALRNAAVDDKKWYEVHAKYAREIVERFPDSEEMRLVDFYRAEAEAIAALGRLEEVEQLFSALAERFPDNAWVYVGWGDIYSGLGLPADVPRDYKRAEEMYRLGLTRCEDRYELEERLTILADLVAEQKPAHDPA